MSCPCYRRAARRPTYPTRARSERPETLASASPNYPVACHLMSVSEGGAARQRSQRGAPPTFISQYLSALIARFSATGQHSAARAACA
eukprot:1087-Prymnesium_polylepis.1